MIIMMITMMIMIIIIIIIFFFAFANFKTLGLKYQGFENNKI